MEEFSAKLVVKPGATPQFHQPHSISYAMKGAIERELDHLEQTRVIEKVSRSEWTAPIVAVPKQDGTVCICGNYKVTVNKELDIDEYPLSRSEDLMTSLTRGQKFSNLDLLAVYQQMSLAEESHQFVMINIP